MRFLLEVTFFYLLSEYLIFDDSFSTKIEISDLNNGKLILIFWANHSRDITIDHGILHSSFRAFSLSDFSFSYSLFFIVYLPASLSIF